MCPVLKCTEMCTTFVHALGQGSHIFKSPFSMCMCSGGWKNRVHADINIFKYDPKIMH